jgi:hypothetical protein
VLYRQHGRNDIGARRWSFVAGVKNFVLYRERRKAAIAEQDKVYLGLERQALAFSQRFGARLAPEEHDMFRALAEFRGHSFWGRRYLMLKYRFLQSDRWLALMGLLR